MLPPLDTLPALPPPYDLLEMRDGQSLMFTVVDYRLGTMTIVPRGGQSKKMIYALRVHVDPSDKPTVPHYWDLTAGLLIAELWSLLEQSAGARRRFRITRTGVAERGRFTVESVPQT
jgi:Mg2+/citrate symporter